MSFVVNVAKLKIFFQRFCKRHIALRRQNLSTFLTPSQQDFAAIGGSHSFSEAVFSFALLGLWLECHFHCRAPSSNSVGFVVQNWVRYIVLDIAIFVKNKIASGGA